MLCQGWLTEHSQKRVRELFLHIFIPVKADSCSCALLNGHQRPSDWQLYLCETNTPAWSSFKRNARADVFLHVSCLSLPVPFQCSPFFHPFPSFCFNSSLPKHLILWTVRRLRADGALLLAPRWRAIKLNLVPLGLIVPGLYLCIEKSLSSCCIGAYGVCIRAAEQAVYFKLFVKNTEIKQHYQSTMEPHYHSFGSFSRVFGFYQLQRKNTLFFSSWMLH